MKKIISIVLVFMGSFILLFATNITSGKLQNEGVNDISATRLHQMMKKKDFTLVNVHVPYDGEIPQTDLFIPYDKISAHFKELPAKDKKIVLYCRSDRMSEIAAKALANAGYSNLYNLNGGMKAWEAAGYQLIDSVQVKIK